MPTPTPPGWYADTDDPAFLRFFDGTSWTTGRAPADRLAEAAPAPSDGPPAPAAPPTPPAASVAPAETREPGPPDTSTGIPTPGPLDPTTRIPAPERHGALSDDSRCYFSLPQDEDVKDVNDHVRCGPVLFVDGDASEPYLSFPLTASGGEGDLRLAVGDQPVEPEPTALDTGERLVRPDDQQAPEGSGDLEPPEPPPAADDVLEAVDLGPTSTGTPPEGASIGSLNAIYELTELATIDRYGVGDSAGRPADDHQLIAFDISQGPGEVPADFTTGTLDIGGFVPQPGGVAVDFGASVYQTPTNVPAG